MDSLHTHLVQAQITWHNPDKNLKKFNGLIDTIQSSDLIVLPEMWNTGFTMKAHLFHKHEEVAIAAMKEWSINKGAAVCGSIIIKRDESYYNSLFFISGGSIVAQYNKRHLFAYSGEDRQFNAGKEKLIIDYKGWKICPNICYDLRFPVWARNYEDYDLLMYVANWPDAREIAWTSLLRARAIENQAYVLGVNCCGLDAWKNTYKGNSRAFSYNGEQMNQDEPGEQIIDVKLNKSQVEKFRKTFPFLAERDAIKTSWQTVYRTDSK